MYDPNIVVLEMMVLNLAELVESFVFVGGATVGIYIDDKAVPKIRTTVDIDCVVEAAHRTQFYQIAERLRQLGFKEDPEEQVVCRFKKGSLTLDVMATDEKILSFTNKWYEEGVRNAVKTKLPSGKEISVFTLPYFLGSKIEAFHGRGKGDYFGSHDLEDIVAVIDGSIEFVKLCKSGSLEILSYIQHFFKDCLSTPDFMAALEGHITDRINSAARAQVILKKIHAIL